MARTNAGSAGMFRGLVAALLLVCIFFLLVPHSHSCVDSDCAICLLRETFKVVLWAVAVAVLLPVLWAAHSASRAVFAPWWQYTLVQLKVKLSD